MRYYVNNRETWQELFLLRRLQIFPTICRRVHRVKTSLIDEKMFYKITRQTSYSRATIVGTTLLDTLF